jgi:hypothetical protein
MTIMVIMAGIPMTAQAEPAQTLPIEAPTCKSQNDCDRDPAHMQQFIASFYRWYVGDELRSWNDPKDQPSVKRAVTKRFFAEFPSIGSPDNTDSDPLTCAQDTPPSWPDNVSVKPLSTQGRKTTFEVRLGASPDDIMVLEVTLVPSDGHWLIDDVKRVRVIQPQGR